MTNDKVNLPNLEIKSNLINLQITQTGLTRDELWLHVIEEILVVSKEDLAFLKKMLSNR